jgi:hypothetical protein
MSLITCKINISFLDIGKQIAKLFEITVGFEAFALTVCTEAPLGD